MELLGYYTTKGRELSAKLLTGTALRITRVTAGGGTTAPDATMLETERQTLAAGEAKREGVTVTLPVTLLAAEAGADYTLTEVGVYASDPDDGEILYRIYRLDEAVNVTAGGQLVIRFDLQETVSEAAEVSVACSPMGLLTQGDLDALRGTPGGFATLDEGGKVPVAQLPYTWGTEELEAGVSPLETGKLHFVYE